MNLIESLKLKWDISLFSLIVTNLIVIVLATTQNWDFRTLLYIYISQTYIIGVFYFISILTKKKVTTHGININNSPISPTAANKSTIAIIFLIIFLIVVRFYSILLGIIKAPSVLVTLSITLFFINHLISFLSNNKADSEKEENLKELILTPFYRILPMHFILFIGNIFNVQIIIFLILKTILDVYMHNYLHQSHQKYSKNKPQVIDKKNNNDIIIPTIYRDNITNETKSVEVAIDKNLYAFGGQAFKIVFYILMGLFILFFILFAIPVIIVIFSSSQKKLGTIIFLAPIILLILPLIFLLIKYKKIDKQKFREEYSNQIFKQYNIAKPKDYDNNVKNLIDIQKTLKNIKIEKGIDLGIRGVGFCILMLVISFVIFLTSWLISLTIIGTFFLIFSKDILANQQLAFTTALIIPIITTLLVNYFVIKPKLKRGDISKGIFLIYLATILLIMLKLILSLFD